MEEGKQGRSRQREKNRNREMERKSKLSRCASQNNIFEFVLRAVYRESYGSPFDVGVNAIFQVQNNTTGRALVASV